VQSLKHPNIVECTETFIEGGKLCIVMDWCQEGDLYNIMKKRGKTNPFPESTILDWFVQICLAVKHVHDRKILHRDLKTQNIFVASSGLLKLGDFGVAKVLNGTNVMTSTAVGTPYYLSPEICQNKRYNHKSDIWSLGCVLYEITCMKHAFDAQSLQLLIHKIVRGTFPPPPPKYSKELRNLITSMLNSDPRKRPSINELLQLPVMRERIQKFLSQSVMAEEFCHTVIHGRPGKGELVPKAPLPSPSATATTKSTTTTAGGGDGTPTTPSRSSSTASTTSNTSRPRTPPSGVRPGGAFNPPTAGVGDVNRVPGVVHTNQRPVITVGGKVANNNNNNNRPAAGVSSGLPAVNRSRSPSPSPAAARAAAGGGKSGREIAGWWWWWWWSGDAQL